ncbi:M23 family metallopeptidase [Egbenema bharatensis]|uniref:M23 family metallopeptidase n=1 Tax=Egbenema bharatensis TaxID=3463334 RepID=UPI003A8924F2
MRISTAAFYTIAALLSQEATAHAIASTPPDLNPSPDTLAPDATPAVNLELVNPIAPVETLPPLTVPVTHDPPSAARPPLPIKPLTPAETVELPKPNPPALLPEIAKPETANPAAAKPNETVTAAAAKPDGDTPSPSPSASPSPQAPAAPAPPLQTVDASELAELAQSDHARTAVSNVQVQALTPEELAALQQQADDAALAGRSRLSLNSLIAPNLAENAIVAFENASESDAANPFDASFLDDDLLNGSLLAQSICEAALSPQQTLPSGICPPDTTVENSSSSAANQDNDATHANVEPIVAPSGESSIAARPTGQTDSAYSVYTIRANSTSARDYYNLSVRPPAQLSNGNASLLFPLSIPAVITSSFGWRTHPVTGAVRFHSGTDIGAPQGTPVLAAFDGRVEVSNFLGGYGLTIVLLHNDGTEQTLYAHLSEIFVRPGDVVRQGEVIGRVGSTGLSTGPHLHFEFRRMTQEGWTVMNPGPALEYALAQMGRSPQIAQSNSGLELPSPFRYSGKFLDLVRVAAQSQDKPDS